MLLFSNPESISNEFYIIICYKLWDSEQDHSGMLNNAQRRYETLSDSKEL